MTNTTRDGPLRRIYYFARIPWWMMERYGGVKEMDGWTDGW